MHRGRSPSHRASVARRLQLACGGALAAWSFAATAAAELEIDYRNPVAGGTLEILVDHAAPYSPLVVFLQQEDGASTISVGSETADAAGSRRFAFPVPADRAGTRFTLLVSENRPGAKPIEVPVRIVSPSVMLTGRDASGAAVLMRIPVDIAARDPFGPAERIVLGNGIPGGVVRDGRSTRTFVISDVARGELTMIEDGRAPSPPIALGSELRGIAISADGRTVLVAAAGALPDENGRLILIEAADPSVRREIDLGYPLGPGGGSRIVVSDDGLRAFVALDGAFLRDVDLLTGKPGSKLLAVGAPGLDEIRDLRIIGGQLIALTGQVASRGESPAAAITGLDVSNPRRANSLRGSARTETLDAALVNGRVSLFLLDGGRGEVKVIDIDRMAQSASYAVPAGADALILAPDSRESRGALLYRAGTPGAFLRPLDLATGAVSPSHDLGFAADAMASQGRTELVDLWFVRNGEYGLVALRPDTLLQIPLAIALDRMTLSIVN